MNAQVRRSGASLLGQVARDDSPVALTPRLTAVVGQPHARSRHGDQQSLRIAGPRNDRVQAKTTAAGLPGLACGVVPESLVERPRRAVVATLEQHAGISTGVQQPVRLAWRYHPDALKRRVPAL